MDEDALPVFIGGMAATAVPGEFSLVHLVYNTLSKPLRFLLPGQVAVPFDVADRHLGFDTLDLVEQILVSHHLTRGGDDGRYRRDSSRHRYVWPAELDLMARIAGLRLERRVADWDGTPFTQDSAKHISVWRKPA